MMIGIAIVCGVVILMVWTFGFIFDRIEMKYQEKERKIRHISSFIKRNNIDPEEADLLYKLLLQ